ncbi:MAG: alpha/beta hydrolase [Bacteroidales bacterium]|nr:alpha/beta hydrolase [Bacteroidales bacterium]
MIHREYEWISADNKKIYGQSWQPEGDTRGVLIIVHGLGEHSGRYKRWASLFAQNGVAVLSQDMIGNGRSEGKHGHIRNYQKLIDQVDFIISKSQELFPGLPVILYGHSWGGTLAANYAMSKDPALQAVIISAPWLKLMVKIPWHLTFLSKILTPVLPSLVINNNAKSGNRCHDPVINEEAKIDPLIHRAISLRMFQITMEQGLFAMKNVYKINRPFLIMHGSGDTTTSHSASEEMARNTSPSTTVKIWDGLYHELHSEYEYQEIFSYVMDWLLQMKILTPVQAKATT